MGVRLTLGGLGHGLLAIAMTACAGPGFHVSTGFRAETLVAQDILADDARAALASLSRQTVRDYDHEGARNFLGFILNREGLEYSWSVAGKKETRRLKFSDVAQVFVHHRSNRPPERPSTDRYAVIARLKDASEHTYAVFATPEPAEVAAEATLGLSLR
ncbi:MAG: hypothetical protein L0216_21420 [Planctomycetales bacterium]|nr:hypothetical protein [Planctomycetales bacterium]